MSTIPIPIASRIDLARIEIHRRKWTILTPGNVTVVRGYRIYWPGAPDEAQSVAHLAHLVHEVVHVWQYKALGVGLYSLRWLDRRYGYTLSPDDAFLSYGLEQQASLIEDAYLVSQGYAPRRARNRPNPHLYPQILDQI